VARARKQPQAGFAQKLNEVEIAAAQLLEVEKDLKRVRGHLHAALRDAHAGGASYAMLGRIAGLSRQRVAQIIERSADQEP